MNPLSTTIKEFSRVCGTEFNADLVQHFLEAYPAQLQINVRKDLGEPQGSGRIYDGVTFFPIRYPVNAMDAPDWLDDRGCPFPVECIQEIGTTGFVRKAMRLGASTWIRASGMAGACPMSG